MKYLMVLVLFFGILATGCSEPIGTDGNKGSVEDNSTKNEADEDNSIKGEAESKIIDIDVNGIPDNIDKVIDEKYVAEPSKSSALKQSARILNTIVSESNNDLMTSLSKYGRAVECMAETFDYNSSMEYNALLLQFLDSKVKVLAYDEFTRNFIEQIGDMPFETNSSSCENAIVPPKKAIGRPTVIQRKRTIDCAPTGKVIFFINGIDNYSDQAAFSRQAIINEYSKIYNVKVKLLYNETNGLLNDLVELLVQKDKENRGYKYFLRKILSNGLDPLEVISLLSLDTRITEEKLFIKFKNIIKKELENNKDVLLMAHSQGNMFATELMEYFNNEYPDKAERLSMIGVASPANDTHGHTTYYTDDSDRVINTLRIVKDDYGNLFLSNILHSNIKNSPRAQPDSDYLHHGFLTSYFKEGLASKSNIDKDVQAFMKQNIVKEVFRLNVWSDNIQPDIYTVIDFHYNLLYPNGTVVKDIKAETIITCSDMTEGQIGIEVFLEATSIPVIYRTNVPRTHITLRSLDGNMSIYDYEGWISDVPNSTQIAYSINKKLIEFRNTAGSNTFEYGYYDIGEYGLYE